MLRHAIIFLAVLIPIPSECQPQRSTAPATSQTCAFTEIVNRGGWHIPGLQGAQVKLAHAHYPTDSGPEVFYDVLKPVRSAASLTLLYCERGATGRIEFRNQPADVTGLSRFTVNHRVFAYFVVAHPVAITQKGERLAIASEERLYYYDPDGTGRFTMMKYAGDLKFRIVVPEWVKGSEGANLSTEPDSCESSTNPSDPVSAGNAALRKSPYDTDHDHDCLRRVDSRKK